VNPSDITLLSFLESIKGDSEIPDGCNVDGLECEGLATREGGRCYLTKDGRKRLQKLQATAVD